jgi:hypothetical protein
MTAPLPPLDISTPEAARKSLYDFDKWWHWARRRLSDKQDMHAIVVLKEMLA